MVWPSDPSELAYLACFSGETGRALEVWPGRRCPAEKKRRDLARPGYHGSWGGREGMPRRARKHWPALMAQAPLLDDERYERREARRMRRARMWWERKAWPSLGELLQQRAEKFDFAGAGFLRERQMLRLPEAQLKALRGMCTQHLGSEHEAWLVMHALLALRADSYGASEGAQETLRLLLERAPGLRRRLARWREEALARLDGRWGDPGWRGDLALANFLASLIERTGPQARALALRWGSALDGPERWDDQLLESALGPGCRRGWLPPKSERLGRVLALRPALGQALRAWIDRHVG